VGGPLEARRLLFGRKRAALEPTVDNKSSSANPAWSLTTGPAPGEVSLAGEIDFSVTPQVRTRLMEVMEAGAPELTLHLADLAYIDSSGLALLIETRKILAEAGRTVRIADISPQVRKLFNLTQLGEYFGLPE
jgi:anti-sigma B factor antagonist